MRRLGHVVLMALVMQLTGMVGICAPAQASTEHDCCPSSDRGQPAAPQSPLPQCCLVTALHERKTVGQTETTSENAPEPKLGVRTQVAAEAYRPGAIWSQQSIHPVSPPLRPLNQSCILLI